MNCRVDGCERPTHIKKRQLCRTHYARFLRNGDPEVDGRALARERRAAERDAQPESERTCRLCGETKPVDEYYVRRTADGYTWRYTHCKGCHNLFRKVRRAQERLENPKPPREKIDRGECAFDGCGNKAFVQLAGGPDGWYCKTHRYHWEHYGELRPIGFRRISIIDEDIRLCTGCQQVKPIYDFFLRAKAKSGDTSNRQSKCRDCMSKVSRFGFLMRTKDWDKAAQVVESMDEPLRSKYEAKYNERINNG